MMTTEKHPKPWLTSYDKEVLPQLQYFDVPLQAFLEQTAEKFPENDCTIFQGNKISYRAVWEYTQNFARHLIQLGCKKGDRIGLALSNSPSFVIAFYGILRAGGVVVAINPQYKESEIAFLVNNADVEIIVGQTENQAVIEKVSTVNKLRVVIISNIYEDGKRLAKGVHDSETWQGNERLKIIPFQNMLDRTTSKEKLPAIDPETDAAVFQYSGGTTGTPKAAIGLHRNLVANTIQFRNWLWSLEDGQETILAAIPLYHVYGMVIGLSVGVMLGATLLLEDDPRNLEAILKDIDAYRPGLFPCVPNLFSGILQKILNSEQMYDLTSLRICISGSAPLLAAVKEEFENATGGKVLEGYGLSEAPTATHCNPLGGKNKTGSIGLPLPDVDCLLAPFSGEELFDGNQYIGELLLRGPQVMAGYHNSPGESDEILKDGWLHTGDIASMDEEGYFYILGRKKELIKIGGLQVWPTEIEEMISKHPAIREVCVAGIPGIEKSEIVKAWVVLKDDRELTENEVKDWVRERLVHYKVPGLVEFRTTLPRTPVGKILRRELVREYVEGMSK